MLENTTLLDWLVKGLVGVLTWLGIRLHNRVDAIEKSKVSVEVIDDLKEQFKEHRQETREWMKELRLLLIARQGKHDPSDIG